MKSNNRCPACGSRRKPSHENNCGTAKANSPECVSYENFDMKSYVDKANGLTMEEVRGYRPQDTGGTILEGDAKAFFAGDKV